MTEQRSQSTENLKNTNTWMRILYMLIFVIAYSVAEIVLSVVVVFQILFKLFTGNLNTRLLRLGKQLSRYIYDVMLFLTFNSEDKPFPFAEWPEATQTLIHKP